MKIRGTTVATPMPRPDWNQTNPRKADFIRNKPVIDNIICSVEGDTIAINDSGNYPLQSVTLYGKSVQNGTPTPSAPMPIVSAGAESGCVNIYAINDIVAMPAITEYSYPVSVVIGEKAVFSVKAIGNNLSYQWQFKSTATAQTWNNSTSATPGYNTDTLTVDANESRNGRPFRCVITDADGNTAYSDVMSLALGEETVYTTQAIENQQITLPTPSGLLGLPMSSGGNYTDENGQQWLSNTKGISADVAVVKCFEFTADMNIIRSDTVYAADDGTPLYMYQVKGLTMDFDYVANKRQHLMFSHGRYRGINNAGRTEDLLPGDLFAYTSSSASNTWIGFLSTIATLEEFKAWLTAQKEAGTPPTALYKLKEPVVTEHDPFEMPHTYKPNTTIVNDAGAGMAVEYVADTKAYIDNKFTELQNAIVATGANV